MCKAEASSIRMRLGYAFEGRRKDSASTTHSRESLVRIEERAFQEKQGERVFSDLPYLSNTGQRKK